ncbi:MAG: BfmA/BtgA family mobilization protein [Bacteroidia bacterium]
MPSIAIDQHTHKEVKIICKTLDVPYGKFVLHSAEYFRKTGIDPSKSVSENPYQAIKELDKRVGQVVGFIKTQEQEKLNPLLEQLIFLTRTLDDSIKILPKSERFDQVIKGVNHHANLLTENHKKQMDFLRQSQQKISDETKQELTALREEQKAIKEAIETKLRGKIF